MSTPQLFPPHQMLTNLCLPILNPCCVTWHFWDSMHICSRQVSTNETTSSTIGCEKKQSHQFEGGEFVCTSSCTQRTNSLLGEEAPSQDPCSCMVVWMASFCYTHN
jgi:hypothetical protein